MLLWSMKIRKMLNNWNESIENHRYRKRCNIIKESQKFAFQNMKTSCGFSSGSLLSNGQTDIFIKKRKLRRRRRKGKCSNDFILFFSGQNIFIHRMAGHNFCRLSWPGGGEGTEAVVLQNFPNKINLYSINNHIDIIHNTERQIQGFWINNSFLCDVASKVSSYDRYPNDYSLLNGNHLFNNVHKQMTEYFRIKISYLN